MPTADLTRLEFDVHRVGPSVVEGYRMPDHFGPVLLPLPGRPGEGGFGPGWTCVARIDWPDCRGMQLGVQLDHITHGTAPNWLRGRLQLQTTNGQNMGDPAEFELLTLPFATPSDTLVWTYAGLFTVHLRVPLAHEYRRPLGPTIEQLGAAGA